MNKTAQTGQNIVLFPLNGGRAGHYYHYLLGYLMPVVKFVEFESAGISLVSVGVLDRITIEILGDEVDIIKEQKFNMDRYPKLRNFFTKIFGKSAKKNHFIKFIFKQRILFALQKHRMGRLVLLDSFDDPTLYDFVELAKFRDVVCRRLANGIGKLKPPASTSEILLVERGKSDEFYGTIGRTSGNERRSIPNIHEVHGFLQRHHSVALINLEDKQLAEQVAAFSGARVVIAQHGAALTNLIWMSPGSLVIEITPPDKMPTRPDQEFFKHLAEVMNIRHQYVLQEHRHADITVEQMRQIDLTLARNAITSQEVRGPGNEHV